MTNIWDVLQNEWGSLSEKWDDGKAKQLSRTLEIILGFVRTDSKYASVEVWHVRGNRPLIGSLEESLRILRAGSFPMSHEVDALVRWTIDALHEFDHAHDGHYTEYLVLKAARGRGKMKKVANELLDYIKDLNYPRLEEMT